MLPVLETAGGAVLWIVAGPEASPFGGAGHLPGAAGERSLPCDVLICSGAGLVSGMPATEREASTSVAGAAPPGRPKRRRFSDTLVLQVSMSPFSSPMVLRGYRQMALCPTGQPVLSWWGGLVSTAEFAAGRRAPR